MNHPFKLNNKGYCYRERVLVHGVDVVKLFDGEVQQCCSFSCWPVEISCLIDPHFILSCCYRLWKQNIIDIWTLIFHQYHNDVDHHRTMWSLIQFRTDLFILWNNDGRSVSILLCCGSVWLCSWCIPVVPLKLCLLRSFPLLPRVCTATRPPASSAQSDTCSVECSTPAGGIKDQQATLQFSGVRVIDIWCPDTMQTKSEHSVQMNQMYFSSEWWI